MHHLGHRGVDEALQEGVSRAGLRLQAGESLVRKTGEVPQSRRDFRKEVTAEWLEARPEKALDLAPASLFHREVGAATQQPPRERDSRKTASGTDGTIQDFG